MTPLAKHTALELFHPSVRQWFTATFGGPTEPQASAWPAIARGESTLLLAPTGSGKTLAAFLSCIDRLMFSPVPPSDQRCRVLYISPLKALAVDIERNLRAPLAGIASLAAVRGDAHAMPTVAVRTGDTPQADRARFARGAADILITTPESLYLLLTSNARDRLKSVDTVIVDEIHALVGTKRGAHLALSLERLARIASRAIQRIGLSATQRPLDEVARFLGGAHERDRDAADVSHRPVSVVDAGTKKPLRLTVEVPVEDMAKLKDALELPSIWAALQPRLLELVQSHRSTLIFVNSRRIAERLAAGINGLAEATLVLAHHGSIARPQRLVIEERLKAGAVRGLVATSSLELGIDMEAVDLVVQVEAPPSVASGMQRVGRAGHGVGKASEGVLLPKYRGDLLACAALTRAMHDGQVEATHYPRNPLDVLAQQLVAMVSMEPWPLERLFHVVRCAAPFAELTRSAFESTLDMLSGRYPSEELSDLKPRITWDRRTGELSPRDGARRVAVVNGGAIADRGLYGVYLIGADKRHARVGELDEEMVFESRVGDTFMLGASTWRIEDITHDRVLVSPAPGRPGRMPFWHGESASRPLELGQRIGELIRGLAGSAREAALERLTQDHGLAPRAAENLLQYLDDQAKAASAVPDDRTVVVERCRDGLGDWRVLLLSPLGGRVLAPWSLAAVARVERERSLSVESLWTNDGFCLRFPDAEEPPPVELLLPSAAEVETLVTRELAGSALLSAKFREAAARALLLPKRRPGGRSPLWQLRKRARDLFAAAARYPDFPILLEAYRECLADVFDMPGLLSTLQKIERGSIRVVTHTSNAPSPFAASVLFGFVANSIYDGDAPLAERRAQVLTIDPGQLRGLFGEAELRGLLDPDVLAQSEAYAQATDAGTRARSADGLHDLLLRLGDLTRDELRARCASDALLSALDGLLASGRVLEVEIAEERRLIAAEDAGLYRDALSVTLPRGVAGPFLEAVGEPVQRLLARFARTRGPFTTSEAVARFGLGWEQVHAGLEALLADGRILRGAFRPLGVEQEWCDAGLLATIRRRSLSKARKEVEPVEPSALGRMLTAWHALVHRPHGRDGLLAAVQRLQGLALPASLLEPVILSSRVEHYVPSDLDALLMEGALVWRGVAPLGERDGWVALYLADELPRLWVPPAPQELDVRQAKVVGHLERSGASFFQELHQASGGGFPNSTAEALWRLTFAGVLTNDTFRPIRALVAPSPPYRGRPLAAPGRHPRVPTGMEGRWSLVRQRAGSPPADAGHRASLAEQLLCRHGIVSRDTVQAEGISGGFGAVYDVLRAMEDLGRVRRGYFVAGVAASQFASPEALDLLRAVRGAGVQPEIVTLSALDPANPYGAVLKWPPRGGGADAPAQRGPSRAAGTFVVLVDGWLAAHVGRGGRQILTYLPDGEPGRSRMARSLAEGLKRLAAVARGGLFTEEVDGRPALEHPLAGPLVEAGFQPSGQGLRFLPHQDTWTELS